MLYRVTEVMISGLLLMLSPWADLELESSAFSLLWVVLVLGAPEGEEDSEQVNGAGDRAQPARGG